MTVPCCGLQMSCWCKILRPIAYIPSPCALAVLEIVLQHVRLIPEQASVNEQISDCHSAAVKLQMCDIRNVIHQSCNN